MIHIAKGREPRALVHFRLTNAHGRFDDAPKSSIRKALLKQQRQLCCYCTRDIGGEHATRIEHWQSRSRFPERALDWSNLFLACDGGESRSGAAAASHLVHCDVAKGDLDITLRPNDQPQRRITYGVASGCATGTDVDAHRDVDVVLRLNASQLVEARKATLLGVQQALARRTGERKQFAYTAISAQLLRWRSNPKAHAGIVIQWLSRRLARA